MVQRTIALAHGNGGEENQALIRNIFYKYFKNSILEQSEDAAVVDTGSKVAVTTDAFTVSPLFFPGGDIGKLAVCGTCNDLAMMGAKPRYVSCSFVIEEGLGVRELERVVRSMRDELERNDAIVVSGDTKVVPKGVVDKLFITTTGIGEPIREGISASALQEGMRILVSRDIGAHGAAIFAAREGIGLESELESDCASLWPQVQALIEADIAVVAMRDATRGGVAAVLNEWAQSSGVCIKVDEAQLPVSEAVRGVCEMLGFEAYNLANEGTFLLCVPPKDEKRALEILRRYHPSASGIATVGGEYPGRVTLVSSWGTKRFLDLPTGELLPRIC